MRHDSQGLLGICRALQLWGDPPSRTRTRMKGFAAKMAAEVVPAMWCDLNVVCCVRERAREQERERGRGSERKSVRA